VSAFGGWIDDQPQPALEQNASTLLAAQSLYADGQSWVESAPGAAFATGRQAASTGPRTAIATGNRLLVAADARIDNRDDLITELGLSPVEWQSRSDSDVLLLGWSRWGEGLLDRLVGDFALAVFDKRERRLYLARDPSGQRPCFYSQCGTRLAFASTPSGLAMQPSVCSGWNPEGFRSALSDELAQEVTYFRGVTRLLPGHCLTFSRGDLRLRRWWNPDLAPLKLSQSDFIDAHRELLDKAVGCRIGLAKRIACYLSSGWDSTAVAASAARAKHSRIIGYTSAPRRGFDGPVPPGYFADESDIAARAAARFGIEHHVLRATPLTLEFLEAQAVAYQDPARNIINAAWGSAIHHAVRESGANILLTGALGNLSLNYGGLSVLPQWISDGRLGDWAKQAFYVSRRQDLRWRSILWNSFGPSLPGSVWGVFQRTVLGQAKHPAIFLHPHLRERRKSRFARIQPSGSPARDRMRMIASLDHGLVTKGALGEAGIDERDPFADRRLIEFSLRLPPDQFLKDGIFRPLARSALADRLPAEILDARLRGLQAADWPARFPQSEASRILDAVEDCSDVAELLDIPALRAAVSDWPETDRDVLAKWELYSRILPATLATAVFIKTFSEQLQSRPERDRLPQYGGA
jgi:asparagine synthase (glutamine-hydrolysing)